MGGRVIINILPGGSHYGVSDVKDAHSVLIEGKKTKPYQTIIGEFYPSGRVNGAIAKKNPKVCTRDTIQTRTLFLGRFARSNATIPSVFRVSAKVIIVPRIDHPADHPMGRNPDTLVHTLRALHLRSGVPIGHLSKKL
jgi:hypothetical protein